jgi:hypothetical protein
VDPEREELPLNTLCVIITRQSTRGQGERNAYSKEKHPDELVAQAHRLGFARVRLLDWDMGVGAYRTTIEQRDALRSWLRELLPSGESKVLLVSQVDRLFRDETEIEHNRFITEVRAHGGWVICGEDVYNFRREFDRERFRQHCRFAKLYVEHQIIGRLHPAAQRAAMAGRYVGGYIPWGYVVDYRDPRSVTYRHLTRYAPHAELVVEHVFRRYAAMLRPSVTHLARTWWREGRAWPLFGLEVDARTVRMFDAHCRLEAEGRGYRFNRLQATHILTNIAYLGWIFRRGEVAREANGSPKVCHEPLVEPDLFWWCFDHLMPVRPDWAPPKRARAQAVLRPRQATDSEAVPFLAHGMLCCATHERPLRHNREVMDGAESYSLRCRVDERAAFEGDRNCISVRGALLEEALCRAFLDQLTLDERDIAALAAFAELRSRKPDEDVARLERQLAEQRAAFDAAKQLSLQAPDLANSYFEEMRRARRAIADIEAQFATIHTRVSEPSLVAWASAQQAAGWAERIKATFLEWSRHWQARVIMLALERAVVGRVDRCTLGLWMRWQGGAEARAAIIGRRARRLGWSAEENAALRAHFHHLTHDALVAMLPRRSFGSLWRHAYSLGLTRANEGPFLDAPPIVIDTPVPLNEMARYGFTDSNWDARGKAEGSKPGAAMHNVAAVAWSGASTAHP